MVLPTPFLQLDEASKAQRGLATSPRSDGMCTSLLSWALTPTWDLWLSARPKKPPQGALSLSSCLGGFSHLRTVVLKTQEKMGLLSSLTDA